MTHERRPKPPRRAPSRASLAACALAACAALGACADLSLLQADVCGNRVVEGQEDCDGQSGCGEPGAANACRYVCDLAKAAACPAGYGCGTDGTCRRHQPGSFETLRTITAATTLDLQAGDVNGDGCSELFDTTVHGTSITAFASRAPGACAAADQALPSRPPAPAASALPAPLLADLTSDGRPELVLAGPGILGPGGLFLYSASAGSTLSPLLYSSLPFRETTVRTLKVRVHGADELLLFLQGEPTGSGGGTGSGMGGGPPGMGGHGMGGGPPGMGGGTGSGPPGTGGGPPSGASMVHVAIAGDPRVKATGFFGLAGTLDGLTLVAADLDPPGGPASARCDELVTARAGEARIQVGRLCGANGEVRHEALPDVELPAGAKLRARAASLAVADMNGDGNADLVTNVDGNDRALYVAYGLGDGRFASSTHPGPGAPDQRMSALPLPAGVADALGRGPSSIFVIGSFDGVPGPDVRALACPQASHYQSPACTPIAGSCEAVVADFDGDGFDDVVASQEQQPGLRVLRGNAGPSFYPSFLDTQCPAHQLAVGDFDFDGRLDVALFDQVLTASGAAETAVKVAYGNPFTPPSEPVGGARLGTGMALAAGRFVAGTMDAPGDQLIAAQERSPGGPAAVAVIEGHDQHQMLAPFYFPADRGSQATLLSLDLLASAGGRFSTHPKGAAVTDSLAVVTRDPATSLAALWLLDGDPNASSLNAVRSPAAVTCQSCVLAAVDTDGDGIEELISLGAGELVLYAEGKQGAAGGLVERSRQPLGHTFESSSGSNPAEYVPRPLVADLDGDGRPDVAARAKNGALVALWGAAGGRFAETELAPPPACEKGPRCPPPQSLALVGVATDGARELAVVGPGKAILARLATGSRALVPFAALPPIATPPPDTDFTAAAAADFDGDGVTDLAVVTSSTFIAVLRGLPVHE